LPGELRRPVIGAPGRESIRSRPRLELLRLVVLDGVMELRFCGARV
jgi:hypothetical protein